MFIRHSTDKVLIGIVVLILFVAVGYQPEYRLSSKMPPRFFGEDSYSSRSSANQKIAWAYWETAEMNVQWKWGYAQRLPDDPPPEFQINGAALGPAAADPVVRLLYWRRLQEVWPLAESWKKEYKWKLDWLSRPLTSIAEWIRDTTDRLLGLR